VADFILRPSARKSFTLKTVLIVYDIPVSISGSRLALLVYLQDSMCMVIWDWRSGQILFVCQPFDP
jgi:hypothetical protein